MSIFIQAYLLIGAVLAAYIVWGAYDENGEEVSNLNRLQLWFVLVGSWIIILLIWPITVLLRTMTSLSRK